MQWLYTVPAACVYFCHFSCSIFRVWDWREKLWGLIATGLFATKAYVAEVYARPEAVDDWGVSFGGKISMKFHSFDNEISPHVDKAHQIWREKLYKYRWHVQVFYGGSGRQLGVQILAAVVIIGWCSLIGILTFGAFKLVDMRQGKTLFTFKGNTNFWRENPIVMRVWQNATKIRRNLTKTFRN